MKEKPYHIGKRGDTMVLSTSSFRTERRSFLHSEVFNRELAAALAACGVIAVFGFFFALFYEITVLAVLASVFLFAVFFFVFRMYVFRETILETVFDRGKGGIAITLKGAIGEKTVSFLLSDLASIALNHISTRPENLDAVQLIERVAVQHGTVIPGFGKTEDFYNVELSFSDRKAVILSVEERDGAVMAIAELKSFLSGLVPDSLWKA